MLKDCFYTDSDKILFWVTGYTEADNTDSLEAIIKSLSLYRDSFSKQFNLNPIDIKTSFIEESRYKYMRVFYVRNIEFSETWFDVYRIEGDDWNMNKWLQK